MTFDTEPLVIRKHWVSLRNDEMDAHRVSTSPPSPSYLLPQFHDSVNCIHCCLMAHMTLLGDNPSLCCKLLCFIASRDFPWSLTSIF